jgi:hypothetical protein
MINLPGNSRTTYLFTAFISSVIFIVLLLLLPKIEKYRVTIDSEQYIGQEMYHYSDLDSDGESELVRFNKNFSGVAAFIVEKKGKILYQHNFEDQYINSDLFYFTGDYNLDKLEEIYVLTTSNDSIFLNVIEGISEHIILNRTFLTQFHYHANLPDYGVMHLELSDFTGSSRKDLFIGFGCGFSYKTRKCAIYNIDENKLVVSEPTGASLQSAISLSLIHI